MKSKHAPKDEIVDLAVAKIRIKRMIEQVLLVPHWGEARSVTRDFGIHNNVACHADKFCDKMERKTQFNIVVARKKRSI